MRLAKGQANILGFGRPPTGAGEGERRFAEPSSEVYGELVPEESLTDDDLCVVKRDDDGIGYGSVCVDIDGKDKRLLMHQVLPVDFENWKLRLATSGRGDPRVLPLDVVHGKPLRSELEASKMWLREKPAFYTYQAPLALPEWFNALSASGQSHVQHHQDFVKRSGIKERGGVAREHSVHTELLRIAMAQDQLQL